MNGAQSRTRTCKPSRCGRAALPIELPGQLVARGGFGPPTRSTSRCRSTSELPRHEDVGAAGRIPTCGDNPLCRRAPSSTRPRRHGSGGWARTSNHRVQGPAAYLFAYSRSGEQRIPAQEPGLEPGISASRARRVTYSTTPVPGPAAATRSRGGGPSRPPPLLRCWRDLSACPSGERWGSPAPGGARHPGGAHSGAPPLPITIFAVSRFPGPLLPDSSSRLGPVPDKEKGPGPWGPGPFSGDLLGSRLRDPVPPRAPLPGFLAAHPRLGCACWHTLTAWMSTRNYRTT